MKKTLIVGLILLLALSLGACNKKDTSLTTNDINTPVGEEDSFKGSLKDLVGVGKNSKCTFVYSDENRKSEGIIYVSDDLARTDIKTFIENKEAEYHTIINGEYIYMWSDQETEGVKMKYIDFQNTQNTKDSKDSVSDSYKEYSGLQNETDFKCTKWVSDNSMFSIPMDIEFIDMTEILENIQEQTDKMQGGNLDNMCSACNMLSGEEKTQCLNNLGCN